MDTAKAFKILYHIQGVLDLHEFWAREKLVPAKFVLVKLCTSSFVNLCASEILSTCCPSNCLYLKISASEICTSKIRASQGPPYSRAYHSTDFWDKENQCVSKKSEVRVIMEGHQKIMFQQISAYNIIKSVYNIENF